MGIYKWERFSDVMFMMLEDPEFVHAAMTIHGEFVADFFDKVLQEIKVDAAVFSEATGGNEGPLISPEMYEEFALQHYKPLLTVLDKHGVDIKICRTYANSRLLIPYLLKYGINCLWACETNIDSMNYTGLREEFGRDLRLIGGIDLDALRLDREAIELEIKRKVPSLLAEGGYIPLADGRIRKEILFENYSYYRNLLEKIISGA
jgi:uroporphyrinogen-III decarboxylase